MTRSKRRLGAWLTCASLVVSLCTGILVGDRASAQSRENTSRLSGQSAQSDKAMYPALSHYAADLTGLARAGRLGVVDNRDGEINRDVKILSRDTHMNPVLIGEAGLGVAQVAQGLAQRMVSGDVPESLRGKRLFSLSLDALVANVKDTGEFAARLNDVLTEAENSNGEVILCVDQLHQYVGSYASKVATDSVRSALDKGQLRIVGAASSQAYTEYIPADQTLTHLFQQVSINEKANDADASPQEKSADKTSKDQNDFQRDNVSPAARAIIPTPRPLYAHPIL